MNKRIKIDHLSTLCVGLDIGSRCNFITALDFDSNPFINMQHVPNAESGVGEMESMILAVLDTNPQFRNLLIAMESTSFYGPCSQLPVCQRPPQALPRQGVLPQPKGGCQLQEVLHRSWQKRRH